MAGELQQTLDRISRKALHLTERYNIVLQEKQAAQRRIAELEQTIEQLRKQIDDLTVKNEYLTVVTTSMPSRKDVERSRALISKLVRDIDKCITELNE